MSKTVKLRKGLDIRLVGVANKVKSELVLPKTVSIKPTDFHGMTPKMVVKEGDQVKAGSIIFFNKYSESIKCASPVSGKVEAIVRGAKRRIMEVIISTDGDIQFEGDSPLDPVSMSSEEVKAKMLASGLWMYIKQRPLDIIADPANEPKAIFVSAFDSSPLAPDFDYVLHGKNEEFQAGLNALAKLTKGTVHLSLNGNAPADATTNAAATAADATNDGV